MRGTSEENAYLFPGSFLVFSFWQQSSWGTLTTWVSLIYEAKVSVRVTWEQVFSGRQTYDVTYAPRLYQAISEELLSSDR